MTSKLVAGLRIATATLLLSLNCIVHILPLLLVALFKLILQRTPARPACDTALMAIAGNWVAFNNWMFDSLTDTKMTITGQPDAMMNGHFMVLSNHQSWVDIPVLQKVFHRRLPFLRFFIKSQLIWVPLLGLAWWALDMPFMKRYTRSQIEKRPELAGRDIEATRKACEKFKQIPVSIVNFAEGTRFTPTKHAAQDSPFGHLLKPRAGGTAFVLDAMGESLDTLVDVTIAYPDGAQELPGLFANRISEIRVDVQIIPIPDELRRGNYQADPAHRERMQTWINALWRAKDERLARLLSSPTA
jgi:1-acyl-sn-glycerol-3-phosphate acyltransferase